MTAPSFDRQGLPPGSPSMDYSTEDGRLKEQSPAEIRHARFTKEAETSPTELLPDQQPDKLDNTKKWINSMPNYSVDVGFGNRRAKTVAPLLIPSTTPKGSPNLEQREISNSRRANGKDLKAESGSGLGAPATILEHAKQDPANLPSRRNVGLPAPPHSSPSQRRSASTSGILLNTRSRPRALSERLHNGRLYERRGSRPVSDRTDTSISDFEGDGQNHLPQISDMLPPGRPRDHIKRHSHRRHVSAYEPRRLPQEEIANEEVSKREKRPRANSQHVSTTIKTNGTQEEPQSEKKAHKSRTSPSKKSRPISQIMFPTGPSLQALLVDNQSSAFQSASSAKEPSLQELLQNISLEPLADLFGAQNTKLSQSPPLHGQPPFSSIKDTPIKRNEYLSRNGDSPSPSLDSFGSSNAAQRPLIDLNGLPDRPMSATSPGGTSPARKRRFSMAQPFAGLNASPKHLHRTSSVVFKDRAHDSILHFGLEDREEEIKLEEQISQLRQRLSGRPRPAILTLCNDTLSAKYGSLPNLMARNKNRLPLVEVLRWRQQNLAILEPLLVSERNSADLQLRSGITTSKDQDLAFLRQHFLESDMPIVRTAYQLRAQLESDKQNTSHDWRRCRNGWKISTEELKLFADCGGRLLEANQHTHTRNPFRQSSDAKSPSLAHIGSPTRKQDSPTSSNSGFIQQKERSEGTPPLTPHSFVASPVQLDSSTRRYGRMRFGMRESKGSDGASVRVSGVEGPLRHSLFSSKASLASNRSDRPLYDFADYLNGPIMRRRATKTSAQEVEVSLVAAPPKKESEIVTLQRAQEQWQAIVGSSAEYPTISEKKRVEVETSAKELRRARFLNSGSEGMENFRPQVSFNIQSTVDAGRKKNLLSGLRHSNAVINAIHQSYAATLKDTRAYFDEYSEQGEATLVILGETTRFKPPQLKLRSHLLEIMPPSSPKQLLKRQSRADRSVTGNYSQDESPDISPSKSRDQQKLEIALSASPESLRPRSSSNVQTQTPLSETPDRSDRRLTMSASDDSAIHSISALERNMLIYRSTLAKRDGMMQSLNSIVQEQKTLATDAYMVKADVNDTWGRFKKQVYEPLATIMSTIAVDEETILRQNSQLVRFFSAFVEMALRLFISGFRALVVAAGILLQLRNPFRVFLDRMPLPLALAFTTLPSLVNMWYFQSQFWSLFLWSFVLAFVYVPDSLI